MTSWYEVSLGKLRGDGFRICGYGSGLNQSGRYQFLEEGLRLSTTAGHLLIVFKYADCDVLDRFYILPTSLLSAAFFSSIFQYVC